MSRPALKTYGRSIRPASSSDSLSNPYGSSPPPYSFSFDRLSTPSPPPAKRHRLSPPSSPLFPRPKPTAEHDEDDEGQIQLPKSETGLVEMELEVENGQKAGTGIKAVSAGGKLGQSTLKGFFTTKPIPKAAIRPLIESRRTANIDPSAPVPSIKSMAAIQLPTKLARSAGPYPPKRPSPDTQLRLTHLPLLHSCKECQMSYVRGGEDEAVHAKHHGRVVRGIPWEGLGRGAPRVTGAGAAKGRALGRSGSDGSGGLGGEKSGPGWKEVNAFKIGGRTGMKGDGGEGRVKVVECDAGYGGAKPTGPVMLEEILSLVDLSLSSPPLPPAILERCKVYLAITSTPPPARLRPSSSKLVSAASSSALLGSGKGKVQKARVVGVVVSQGIKWAMRVLDEEGSNGQVDGVASGEGSRVGKMGREGSKGGGSGDVKAGGGKGQRQTLLRMASRVTEPAKCEKGSEEDKKLQSITTEIDGVCVGPPRVAASSVAPLSTADLDVKAELPTRMIDSGDGVMCDPTSLPTPLGIHRLYTIPTYRSLGIAEHLLDAACKHTIYACPARPEKGQVAFSQPTQSGARMMRRWGKGGVRVFVDDESQI